jgi:HK97 family phage major capsid protein
MSKLTELQGKLEDLRAKAAKAFDEAGDDLDMSKVTSIEGDSTAKAAQLKAWNDEMNDLGVQIDEMKSLDDMKGRVDKLGEVQPHPGHSNGKKRGESDDEGNGGDEDEVSSKAIGDLFVESDEFKGYKRGDKRTATVTLPGSLKNLFETATGWAPADIRGPRIVDFATRPLAVAELLPQSTTTAASVIYMEETLFSNSAAEVAEGAAKPEVSLGLEEVVEPVRKIAAFLPVTEEQLADVPQARAYINNRLGFMVRQRLDTQILVGNGTAPNLSGITDRTGIQTQALGGDNVPDAVYKAMTKIRVNAFSEPNAAIFHPNDWQTVRLLKTSDGLYIWGAPMDAGPERIWGIRVLQTTGMTENTALVGDFQQASLIVRSGVDIRISDSHDDYFVKNLLAVVAEMRVALAVYRPAAFATVTGI